MKEFDDRSRQVFLQLNEQVWPACIDVCLQYLTHNQRRAMQSDVGCCLQKQCSCWIVRHRAQGGFASSTEGCAGYQLVFVVTHLQGLNVSLYWKNPDPRKYVNVVPTSAITGEGIPDLLQLMVKLTQSMMQDRLTLLSETQATVS